MTEQEKTGRDTIAPKLKDRMLKDIFPFVDPYHERGRAVSCAAILDEMLRDILLAYFLPIPEKLEDELFEGYGPFSGFYARIETAYVLGLISENERKNLNLIRKIRRDFAHEPGEAIRFEQQDIKNRCRELELPQTFLDKIEVDWNNPRIKFLGTYVFTVFGLIFRKRIAEHQAKAEPIPTDLIEALLEPESVEQIKSHFLT